MPTKRAENGQMLCPTLRNSGNKKGARFLEKEIGPKITGSDLTVAKMAPRQHLVTDAQTFIVKSCPPSRYLDWLEL